MRFPKEMSTSQAKGMIAELAMLGAESITFIGGEPLFRKDIGTLITFAHQKGLLTSISTNCEVFEQKAAELKDLDVFATCLNGSEKIHDAIRGKGNYQKVLNALSSIKKGKVANCVVTQQNINEVDFILSIAKENKFFVYFQPVFHNELAKVEQDNLDHLLPEQKAMRDVFEGLLDKKKLGYPILNSYGSLEAFAKQGNVIFSKCLHGELSITIDPQGNVFRCYKYVNRSEKNNGFQKGFRNAMQAIQDDGCRTCMYGCHIEDNYLFNFNVSSLFNLLKMHKLLGE